MIFYEFFSFRATAREPEKTVKSRSERPDQEPAQDFGLLFGDAWPHPARRTLACTSARESRAPRSRIPFAIENTWQSRATSPEFGRSPPPAASIGLPRTADQIGSPGVAHAQSRRAAIHLAADASPGYRHGPWWPRPCVFDGWGLPSTGPAPKRTSEKTYGLRREGDSMTKRSSSSTELCRCIRGRGFEKTLPNFHRAGFPWRSRALASRRP